MNLKRRNRLLLILAMISGVASATAFALYAFNQNMMFFFTPTQVAQGKAPAQSAFRVGGMVVDGSIRHIEKSARVEFAVTDQISRLTVIYDGILPDLFREGQGVVVRGHLNQVGRFVADEVLAKHDENYMPPEVAATMAMPATHTSKQSALP